MAPYRFTVSDTTISVDLPPDLMEDHRVKAVCQKYMSANGSFNEEVIRWILGSFLVPPCKPENLRYVAMSLMVSARACPAIRTPLLAQALILSGELHLFRVAIQESWPVPSEIVTCHLFRWGKTVRDFQESGGTFQDRASTICAYEVFCTVTQSSIRPDMVAAFLLAADMMPPGDTSSPWLAMAAYLAGEVVASMRGEVAAMVAKRAWPTDLVEHLANSGYFMDTDKDQERGIRIAFVLLEMGCPFNVDRCIHNEWINAIDEAEEHDFPTFWYDDRIPEIVHKAVTEHGAVLTDPFVQLACYYSCEWSLEWIIPRGHSFTERHVIRWADGRLVPDCPEDALSDEDLLVGNTLLRCIGSTHKVSSIADVKAIRLEFCSRQ